MTDDRSGASVVRPDETRITAAATDWRAAAQMLGPRDATWSLPLIDVLLGAACLLIAWSDLSFIDRFGIHAVYVADTALAVVIAAAQPLRRRMVRVSFIVTAVALALYALLTCLSPVLLGLSPLTLTALTSLHAVARWCPDRRWGRAALGAALVGAVVNPVTMTMIGRSRSAGDTVGQPQDPVAALAVCTAFTALIMLAALLVVGDAWRRRRLAEGRLRQLARERAAAAASERLELARELHDLLGHSLTAIKVQAATALAVGQAQALAATLSTIEQTAAASLDEVRDLVRALRGSSGDAMPPADLDGIDRAMGAAVAAGLALEADLPDPAELARANGSWPLLQRLTVLRAVQEGLTNALRHGAGAAALRMEIARGRCTVLITNPVARSDRKETTGSGLAGLGERIRLTGGTMEAGPRELDGAPGFRLAVSLPVAAGGAPDASGTAESERQEDHREHF